MKLSNKIKEVGLILLLYPVYRRAIEETLENDPRTEWLVALSRVLRVVFWTVIVLGIISKLGWVMK